MTRPPLSVLDLAVVTEGGTSAEALAVLSRFSAKAQLLGNRMVALPKSIC